MREEERGVYSKKPISRNAKPSSDAPQTKQTKHLIKLIVRDIPQLNGCVPMRARCVVTQLIPKIQKSPESLQQNVTQVTELIIKNGHFQSPCMITTDSITIIFITSCVFLHS